MRQCKNCGARVEDWESACPYCGSGRAPGPGGAQAAGREAGPQAPPPGAGTPPFGGATAAGGEPLQMFQGRKDRTLAVLLAFFLGCVGGHWFYLGRWSKALGYFFFSWTLIPFFLGIRDGVRMLGMPR